MCLIAYRSIILLSETTLIDTIDTHQRWASFEEARAEYKYNNSIFSI